MKRSTIALCVCAALAAAIALIAVKASAGRALSEPLTLASANAALSASGGMVGNIFAIGDNRYQVRRSQLTRKIGSNVFVGEIEIAPLPKHE